MTKRILINVSKLAAVTSHLTEEEAGAFMRITLAIAMNPERHLPADRFLDLVQWGPQGAPPPEVLKPVLECFTVSAGFISLDFLGVISI